MCLVGDIVLHTLRELGFDEMRLNLEYLEIAIFRVGSGGVRTMGIWQDIGTQDRYNMGLNNGLTDNKQAALIELEMIIPSHCDATQFRSLRSLPSRIVSY